MMFQGLEAIRELKENFGLNVRLLQMASIKPIDSDAIIKSANETGLIITVEEHNIIGGLGSAVAEVIVAPHALPSHCWLLTPIAVTKSLGVRWANPLLSQLMRIVRSRE